MEAGIRKLYLTKRFRFLESWNGSGCSNVEVGARFMSRQASLYARNEECVVKSEKIKARKGSNKRQRPFVTQTFLKSRQRPWTGDWCAPPTRTPAFPYRVGRTILKIHRGHAKMFNIERGTRLFWTNWHQDGSGTVAAEAIALQIDW